MYFQGGLQLVIPPLSQLDLEETDISSHLSHLSYAHGLIYVMEDNHNMSAKVNGTEMAQLSCKLILFSISSQKYQYI